MLSIITIHRNLRRHTGHIRVRRTLPALLLCLLTTACTNSKLIIGPLYNRLDDRMLDSVQELVDLGDQQQQYVEQRVRHYHAWHRQQELPRYAALLSEISTAVAPGQHASADQIAGWFDRVYAHADLARACHPAHFSADGLRTLSDEQVRQFELRLAAKREEDRERRAKRTREERQEHRFNNAVKWSRRAGLTLDAAQKARLQAAFDARTSLSKPFREGASRWRAGLFEVLGQRRSADFPEQLATHLDGMWRWLERDQPEAVAANRQVWLDYAIDLEASLSDEQRRSASQWIAGLASTLNAIAADADATLASAEPSPGCAVEPAAIDTPGVGSAGAG